MKDQKAQAAKVVAATAKQQAAASKEQPKAPETKAPEAPKAEAPKQEAPKAEAPKAPEAPKQEAPKAPEAPKQEAPKAEAPKAPEAPKQEAPKQEAPKAPEAPKQETPAAPTNEKVDLYVATLAELRKMIPKDKFEAKENKSGITWFGPSKTRLMKMVESKKGLRIEFNVEVSKVDGLTILTEQEAKDKHMGTCRWIYSGNNIENVKKLVAEAIQKFEPKKRSDSMEEKSKKEAEAAKQDDKNGAVTTRQLTPEEAAKLGATKSEQEKQKEMVEKMQQPQAKAN